MSGTILPVAVPSFTSLAQQYSIPIYTVSSLDHTDVHQFLQKITADIFCVACFPKKFSCDVLQIPAYGCLNIHPSLLPKHRGPDPLFCTLQNGEAETGVTIHVMDERYDTGNIIVQQVLQVDTDETYATLVAKCAELGGKLLIDAIDKVYRKKYTGTPQDESLATYESFTL
jgi:methionyl-tRNA formyltransferase